MKVKPARYIKGEITLPGDKSITHRAIIFSSLSDGLCKITNIGTGRDNASTIKIFRKLGVSITKKINSCTIKGVGLRGLKEPKDILNAENSGTTIRIVSGLLAAQPFFSVITGDRYLVKRPMKRVIEPLTLMGADIKGRENNSYPPLAITGNSHLKAINYKLSVASAQVKSAILMAAMYADGITTITEPALSRDHTERLMKFLGIPVKIENTAISISSINKIPSFSMDVCGDISSAAFFMVAAALLPGSNIIIKNLSLNPGRIGIIDVLKNMKANIKIENYRESFGEPVGDVIVKGTGYLKATEIKGEIIPRVIDEIPILAVAASFADGVTVIDDAAELRVKESDRIKAIVDGLKKLKVNVEELPAGIVITGKTGQSFAKINTYGDHRIAMAFYIYGLCSKEGLELDSIASVSISFPTFFEIMGRLINA